MNIPPESLDALDQFLAAHVLKWSYAIVEESPATMPTLERHQPHYGYWVDPAGKTTWDESPFTGDGAFMPSRDWRAIGAVIDRWGRFALLERINSGMRASWWAPNGALQHMEAGTAPLAVALAAGKAYGFMLPTYPRRADVRPINPQG